MVEGEGCICEWKRGGEGGEGKEHDKGFPNIAEKGIWKWTG